ncbi:MAG: NAD(P)/FAD-dependent oxidoreductase [Abditibacteriota bacterium]|nr:NAD(P)/FAD-dependent oxidoreductase [Abditibacteriota bacterium]
MKNYVIIGNGTAALGCIEGIRKVDKDGKITVVSEENRPVYCRPLISYYLEDKTDENKMNCRPDDFYEVNGCEVIYGRKATEIDPEAKTVSLEGGTVLPYTSLCVATGSSPFVPPFNGLDTVKSKFSFMTMDDAVALKKAVDETSRVLIIGAGLIGLKCAEGLIGRAGSITVCDLADRVLPSILDEECAEIVKNHLEEKGITLLLGDSAQLFEGHKSIMKSGKTVDFDVLVIAVGVRPNTAIAKNAGCDVPRGIAVNERSETTVKDIYAAGDCTQCRDISDDSDKILALLPNAYFQGHAAGVNMAGGDEVFDKAVPMNSLGLLGLHIMTAGSRSGELLEEKSDLGFKRFFIGDNKLVGFIIMGDTERAGIYTSLIRERTPLDSVDFASMVKVASSISFDKDIRAKKFGSVV